MHKHVESAEKIAEIIISKARERQKKNKVIRKRVVGGGPALPGKLADCTENSLEVTELFLVEGRLCGRFSQAGKRSTLSGNSSIKRENLKYVGT